ncbi:MAG: hypothetical protein ACXV7F_00090 [Methylomonas sp.]
MKKLLLTLLAILLIFEEWLWDALSAFGLLLRLANFERWLSRTSPAMALVCLSIPIVIVTPINLLALWMMLHGAILKGILWEAFAKLLGTLLVARVFALTKPQLLTFSMVALIYDSTMASLRWAHAKIVDTDVYHWYLQLKGQARAKMAELLR